MLYRRKSSIPKSVRLNPVAFLVFRDFSNKYCYAVNAISGKYLIPPHFELLRMIVVVADLPVRLFACILKTEDIRHACVVTRVMHPILRYREIKL